VPLIAVHGRRRLRGAPKALGEGIPDWPEAFAARKVVWNSCLVRQPSRRAVTLARDLMSLAEQGGDPAQCDSVPGLGFTLRVDGLERSRYVDGPEYKLNGARRGVHRLSTSSTEGRNDFALAKALENGQSIGHAGSNWIERRSV